jgi:Excreted virulence factor EspC, type VII ESX diderm
MAATEVRADPIELTRLADRMFQASEAIAGVWRGAQSSIDVPMSAFGDISQATALAIAYYGALDAADVTLDRLATVLEGDMDRLYRVAFAYQKADDDAAGRFPPTPI